MQVRNVCRLLVCLLLALACRAGGQTTITPKALVVASAPAQVQNAQGVLVGTTLYPGTLWQVRVVATLNVLVYHYSTGIDYPLLKYSDTLGNTWSMAYPRSCVFGANTVTITGNTSWKTVTDQITLSVTPTSAGYHLSLQVTSVPGVVECVINADLDPALSVVKGLGISTVNAQDIGDATASTSTVNTANPVPVNLSYGVGNDYWYTNWTEYNGENLEQVSVHTAKFNFDAFDSDIASFTLSTQGVDVAGHVHGGATKFAQHITLAGLVTVTLGTQSDSVQVVSPPGQCSIAGHTLQTAQPH